MKKLIVVIAGKKSDVLKALAELKSNIQYDKMDVTITTKEKK